MRGSRWRECSPTRKKAGVCAIMSIWLVHIKEHVWTVGTCPTTILLSAVTMCACVCEWQQWRRLYQEDLHAAWGMRPVCSPGSWSGRGWLPLILAWHSQKWLALAAKCEAVSKALVWGWSPKKNFYPQENFTLKNPEKGWWPSPGPDLPVS